MSPAKKSAVLLIHSRHRLLVEEELKKMRKKMSEKVDLDFNYDVFEAGEDNIEEAIQAADTLPLASDMRFVVINEAQRLSPSEVKKLAKYVDDPAESSLLVLAAVEPKKNSPLLRLMQKGGRTKELEKARSQIPGWIRSRFKERGLKVTGKAIAYLQEALGDDLIAIDSAVEKVGQYHEGEASVELDEVVSLVTPSAEKSIYELVDRVAVGDADQSIKLLRRLLQQGEKPTYILAALSRRFRMLLLYFALREEGRQDSDIIAHLKLPSNQSWMVGKKFRPQASRLDEEKLRRALSLLVKADYGIKSGELDDVFAVEAVVSSLSTLTSRK
jgi:DNA polymerase-3 subunit delta